MSSELITIAQVALGRAAGDPDGLAHLGVHVLKQGLEQLLPQAYLHTDLANRDDIDAGFGQRLSTPKEQAKPLVFLNSAMASFVSGQILTVDFAGRASEIIGLTHDRLDSPMLAKAGEA